MLCYPSPSNHLKERTSHLWCVWLPRTPNHLPRHRQRDHQISSTGRSRYLSSAMMTHLSLDSWDSFARGRRVLLCRWRLFLPPRLSPRTRIQPCIARKEHSRANSTRSARKLDVRLRSGHGPWKWWIERRGAITTNKGSGTEEWAWLGVLRAWM